MTKRPDKVPPDTRLRARAEKLLAGQGAELKKMPLVDIQKLVYELRLTKLELEIQNEELRHAYQKIEDERARYLDLYDFAPIGYFTLDPQGLIVQANLSGARLLRVERDHLLHRPFSDLVLAAHRPVFHAHLQEVLTGPGKLTCELQLIPQEGFPFTAALETLAVRDEQGKVTQCRTTVTDITHRKRAEEDLKLKERLLDGASDSIFLHDLEGRFLYLNEAAYKDRGYEKEELLGENLSVLPTAEFAGTRAERLGELLAKGEIIFESAHFRKDGSVMPVEIHARLIDLHERQLILSVARDITARQQAADALLAAAAKWRTTFDAIGDAVCLLDQDCKILQCNQALADLVGKPFPEIIGQTCWGVMHGTAGPIDQCPLVRMRQSRRRETLTFRRGDRWLHVMVDPILDQAGAVVGGSHIIADITQFKRAEEKIRDLNTLLKAIKEINEALLRARSEPELFQQTCDLLTRVPYVRFAWIGLVRPESFAVQPAAWAGHEDGYLSAITITWDDSPHGQGHTGTAIKTGKPAVVKDIDADPLYQPWRQAAQRRGYASSVALPLVHEGTTLGVLNVYSGKKDAFGEEELDFLTQVAGDIAVGVKSLRLEQGLAQSVRQLQSMMEETVEAIASMAEMRDPYTAGHQRGVTRLACALARELGLDDHRIEGLRVAGFLHDIGKITVPAEILNKPGKLSTYEFNIIKNHAQVGHDILEKIAFPWPVAQVVLEHHERWDGSGYPRGLTGHNILQEARILMVADVVEAMAAHRPYRPALGLEQALAEISQNRGRLYDPEVVDVCLTLFTGKGFSLDE